jgi:manganese oxidase
VDAGQDHRPVVAPFRRVVRGLAAAALPALAAVLAPAAAGAATRDVWVAAVPATWNAVPNARDAMHGTTFTPGETTFPTVVYRRYTKDWRKPVTLAYERRAGAERLTGPLIRARVGDELRIHFKNLDTLRRAPHSMHFHGVEYEPSSDGIFLPLHSGKGGAVMPGRTFTYELTAGKASAGIWPYHDHSQSMEESIAGGMYGALSIAGRGERRADREFLVAFAPWHGFQTIDGRAFVGNTSVFRASVGDRVQWDVMAMGDEFHTFHVHGHRWRTPDGTPEDTRGLGPAESFRVSWKEDAPGTWLYHCHVETHMMQGMIGLYRVDR